MTAQDEFLRNPPASNTAVIAAKQRFGERLPSEYLAFMQVSNGGEGFIAGNYLVLWPLENLEGYGHDYRPDGNSQFVLFGSNGGGELFAFDSRKGNLAIVETPAIGNDETDALICAHSFADFMLQPTAFKEGA